MNALKLSIQLVGFVLIMTGATLNMFHYGLTVSDQYERCHVCVMDGHSEYGHIEVTDTTCDCKTITIYDGTAEPLTTTCLVLGVGLMCGALFMRQE